jgi:hypothetical protein
MRSRGRMFDPHADVLGHARSLHDAPERAELQPIRMHVGRWSLLRNTGRLFDSSRE